MLESPPLPWEKGKHKDHTVFHIEVQVCMNEHGQVFSTHHLQDAHDQQIVQQLPSGGLNQSAVSLLLEAVRREVNLQVLIRLSNDKTLKGQIKDPQARDLLEKELTTTVKEVLGKQIASLSLPSVQEMLDIVRETP